MGGGNGFGLRQIQVGLVGEPSEIHNSFGRVVDILHKLNEAICRQIGHSLTQTFNGIFLAFAHKMGADLVLMGSRDLFWQDRFVEGDGLDQDAFFLEREPGVLGESSMKLCFSGTFEGAEQLMDVGCLGEGRGVG